MGDFDDQTPMRVTVPGEPMGKQRPRRASNIKGTYTPAKTVNYETYVKELFTIAYPDFEPMTGAVGFRIAAYLKIPESKSKRKKGLMVLDEVKATKIPDLDNVLKIIMDALEGLAYLDDKQVISAFIHKKWSNKPRVDINIYDLEKAVFEL
jgi:Holliday junction resolvase RusA-like endonuclease